MEKRFKRIEKIEDKIQSAKLPYNAWKVLFLLDDETTASKIVSLLDEKTAAVEEALSVLAEAGLIEVLGEEPAVPAEPEPITEEQEPEFAEEVESVGESAEDEDTFLELTESEEAESVEVEEEIGPEEIPEEETEEVSFDLSEPEQAVSAQEENLEIPVAGEAEEMVEEQDTLDMEFEPVQAEKEPEETVRPAPAAKVSDSDKKVVLVIDDSIVIRKMVEIALEDEEEIQLETSISGKEGLNKMDQINPDLVILDMMLPDINGVEILKTIKASRGIPVIMLSGKDSPQLVEKAKSEGADEFLPKPFRDDELVEKIKALLKKG